MKLSEALSLKRDESIAFVGAGGKSSAMFALAQELAPPVVMTTTTHVGVWQARGADQHIILQTPKDVASLNLSSHGRVLLTGPAGRDDRLVSPDEKILEQVRSICQQQGIPLLIEADGAQLRNLKAPAAHEPQVPYWVDIVLVVAGLGGLGEQLNLESVFRPELFSKISGLPIGETIRVTDVVKVLRSEQGGLKDLPKDRLCCLFLNQAEGPALMGKGNRIAQGLLDAYGRVLIGSLQQPAESGPVFSAHTQTAGIILAAGGSERLGQPKQLLAWEGKPYVLQVTLMALAAGLAPLYVVTGEEREAVEEVLAELPVRCIYNPNWAKGQSTSMQAGIEALPTGCQNVVFLLSDQPQISPLLIRGLIERRAEKQSIITAPMADGRRANPVLFRREAFDALKKVKGDQGGRAVFNQFKVDWLPWVDSRILLDVDQLADEQRLHDRYFGDLTCE